MTTTQSQKLWGLGISAATAVALSWSLTFAGHLSILALLILVPYILPVVHSLDATARLWVFAAAPVIQFSLYGFILGGAWLRGWLRTGAIVLAAFHIVAIIVCYLIFTSHIDLYDMH